MSLYFILRIVYFTCKRKSRFSIKTTLFNNKNISHQKSCKRRLSMPCFTIGLMGLEMKLGHTKFNLVET